MSDLITPRDLQAEMIRLSGEIDRAHTVLVAASHEWATAENEYRLARSNAYLATTGTVNERQARVDKTTGAERHAAHLADALRVAALEAVRNKRAQLSALQSIANAIKSEIEMAR